MKRTVFISVMLLLSMHCLWAQDFITRGRIEFEVKTNQRLLAWQRSNGGISADELNNINEFAVSYRELLFAGNQWTYKPIAKGSDPADKNGEGLYISRNTGLMEVRARYIEDQTFTMRDSIREFKWKIGNETRQIAGWQCRKAMTKIDDSIYVIAFYCPEIVPQGGPELFNGLPGMILGLAIPRSYTTWFATKIELADVDESKITPPRNGKDKVYGKKELAELLTRKYKESGWTDASVDKVLEMLGRHSF